MENKNKISGATEDNFTGGIEAQTSQIPSTAFLGAALGSMALAAILKASRRDQAALFVGQWAAPLRFSPTY